MFVPCFSFNATATTEIYTLSLHDALPISTPSIAWAKDNKTLFFVRQDLETLRAFQLLRFETGTKKLPELVYEEKDTTYEDRKSTRLNSSHSQISYAVFCLKKKKQKSNKKE